MDFVPILICLSGKLNEFEFMLLKQEKANMLKTNATIATNDMIRLQYILTFSRDRNRKIFKCSFQEY